MQRTGSRPDFRDKPHVSRTVCRRDCTCRHGNLRGDGYDTAGHQFPLFPEADFHFSESGPGNSAASGSGAGIRHHPDEIFAVAIGHDGSISKEYFSGLISLPILGCPRDSVRSSPGKHHAGDHHHITGIALYGMFIAVVVPKARENRHVLITVILAIIISTVIRYVPVFSGISAGFAIIISAVIASWPGLYSSR